MGKTFPSSTTSKSRADFHTFTMQIASPALLNLTTSFCPSNVEILLALATKEELLKQTALR